MTVGKAVFLAVFFGCVLTLLSLSHKPKRIDLVDSEILDNRIDTFKSENYVQIVKWKKGVISNIRVQQIKPSGKEGIYILSQDLDFDSRGILDSLYMFHGKRLVPVDYGSSVRYQTNYVYFDTLGNVQDFRFMKDFTYQFGNK